jgi:arginase family enzyme
MNQNNMKIIKVPFDAGGLGKTKGCSKAPDILKDEGIVVHVDNNNISDSFSSIEQEVRKQKPNLIIGGDHSITYPCFKGSGCDGIIVFDAHPDVENNFSPPTHEDYLRVLVEENIVDAKNILLIGLRNISPNEKDFLNENNIRCIDMQDIIIEPIE